MKRNIYLIAAAGITFDQVTKIMAQLYLSDFSIIPGFFHLTYVENNGAAWGMFSGNRLFLVMISVFVLLLISHFIKKEKNITLCDSISYGLLIGGIFGNLIDRVFRGYVIDFLNFNILGYDFPVFNVADSAIVIAVILMFFEVIGVSIYGNKSK